MKNEDSHINQQLQDLFNSFEPPVPKGAWDGVVGKMERNHKRRIAIWWFSAACALLCIIAGIWSGLHHQKNQAGTVKQEVDMNKNPQSDRLRSKTAEQPVVKNKPNTDYPQDLSGKNETTFNEAVSPKNVFSQPEPKTITMENHAAVETVENTYTLPEPFNIRVLGLPYPVADAPVAVNFSKPSPFYVPRGKWFVSAGVQQNLNSNSYTVNSEYSRYVHKNYLNRMEQGEQAMGSIGFNMQLGYHIHKNVAFTGGVQFRQLNTRQQFSFSDEVPVTLMPGNTPDKFGNYPIIGYFGSTGSVSYSGFQRNTIIEVPLGVMTDFTIAPQWTLKPALTLNTGFVSSMNGFTLDYQQLQITRQRNDWYRTVQFSGALSVGVFRKISRNLQWGASVMGTRMLTPAYVPGASVRPRNQALGFGTQLIWRID